ncbi:hypothetical protein D3C72_614850 [compost metagenome]
MRRRAKSPAASSSPRNSPARFPASPSARSSHGCSRSTTPSAPARPATALASSWPSTPIWSSRTATRPYTRAPSPPGRAAPRRSTPRPCSRWPSTTASRWTRPGAICRNRPRRSSCKARAARRSSSSMTTTPASTRSPRPSKASCPIWNAAGARPTVPGSARNSAAISPKPPVRSAAASASSPRPWRSRSADRTSPRSAGFQFQKLISGSQLWMSTCRTNSARSAAASSRRSPTGCASSTTSASITSACRAVPAPCRAARASASAWPRRSAPA